MELNELALYHCAPGKVGWWLPHRWEMDQHSGKIIALESCGSDRIIIRCRRPVRKP